MTEPQGVSADLMGALEYGAARDTSIRIFSADCRAILAALADAARLDWLRSNCRVTYWGPKKISYPIEHAVWLGKDQWDVLMHRADSDLHPHDAARAAEETP